MAMLNNQMVICMLTNINGNFRILKWRYLPFFSGLFFRAYVSEYHHKIWPYMVLTYLHFRILKWPLIICMLCVYILLYTWLVVDLPLWKIWLRQLGWWNSQLIGKIIQMLQTTNQNVIAILRFNWKQLYTSERSLISYLMIDTWYLCVSYRIIDSSNNDSYLSDVESLTADKSWYQWFNQWWLPVVNCDN